jgi:hypothetical protein
MNKKGFVGDIITLGVIIFVIVLTIMIAHSILKDFQEGAGDTLIDTDTAKEINQSGFSAITALDNAIIFVVIALFLFAVVSSFFIRTHPVVFVGAIGALIIAVILAVSFSNVYDEMASASSFDTFEDDFSKIPYILNNFPLFVLIMGGMIILAIYAKERFT